MSLTLAAIKAFHSTVFLVMLCAIVWLVATGITRRRDRSVAVAGGLVAIECAVFVANHGVCPLTPLAERHGASRGGVSDIFLPDALARTIPLWATPLVVLGTGLHVWAWLDARRSRTRGRSAWRRPYRVVRHDVRSTHDLREGDKATARRHPMQIKVRVLRSVRRRPPGQRTRSG